MSKAIRGIDRPDVAAMIGVANAGFMLMVPNRLKKREFDVYAKCGSGDLRRMQHTLPVIAAMAIDYGPSVNSTFSTVSPSPRSHNCAIKFARQESPPYLRNHFRFHPATCSERAQRSSF